MFYVQCNKTKADFVEMVANGTNRFLICSGGIDGVIYRQPAKRWFQNAGR